MEYVFSAANQALLAAGKLVQATTKTGYLLPMLKDPVTGNIIEVAKGVAVNHAPFSPFIAANPPVGAAMLFGKRMLQVDQVYPNLEQLNVLQQSLGVLQATTAVIGVGVAVTAALSAVNLWQTLKLRQDVKQLRLEVRDGFIDLKQALRNQGLEVIQHIDQVAQDITFNQHRLEFIKAYSRFLEATKLLKTATAIQDIQARNIEFSNARQTLGESLAIYNSSHILSETSAVGQLRRYECSWIIEQAIALTYDLQGEPKALSDRLSHLQNKIRQDALKVIENCQTEDELDFLFPEITRIHDHDLAALELWQNQIDWLNSLSPSELELLDSADFHETDSNSVSDPNLPLASLEKPPEQVFYESLKEKSHPLSLEDQLKFLMNPDLRREAENYVSQNAEIARYRTLNLANLQKASNLTVANLFWYFKMRDESEVNEREEEAVV